MRAEQFAEELAMDRQRLFTWSVVSALHSAFWSLRDDTDKTRNWHAAMDYAEALANRAF